MVWLWLIFFCSLTGLYLFSSKKLLSLLFLELCFVSLISIYYFCYGGVSSMDSFSCMMFMGYMVMESVLGLCLLVYSGRNSASSSEYFFVS